METSKRGRLPRVPIPQPFPTDQLLEKHRTSRSFKERHVVVNPLLPDIAEDGTRVVTRVDKWALAIATSRRGQEHDDIEIRAEVYARVVFTSDGTSGWRACGWGHDADTTLGDSDMRPIYHSVSDTTSLGSDSCPSNRGLAAEDFQFQITQHWGPSVPRPGERARLSTFYELTVNRPAALIDLQTMFETPPPGSPKDSSI
jgi:hypothetical protein